MTNFLTRLFLKRDDDITALTDVEQDMDKVYHQELQDYKRLVSLFQKKRKAGRQVLEVKDYDSLLSTINEMYSINNSLLLLLRRFTVHEMKERNLYDHQLSRLLEAHPHFAKAIQQQEAAKNDVQELRRYLWGLTQEIKALYNTILKQNSIIKVIKEKKVLNKDEQEYRILVETETNEAAIEDNLNKFLLQAMRKAKEIEGKVVEEIEIEKRKKQQTLKFTDIQFREITDIAAGFNGFYEIYKRTFPRDEQESKKALQDYLKVRYTDNVVNTSMHLIGAFYKGECVGGSFFVFIQHREFCFGMIWWVLLAPEFRGCKVESKTGNVLFSVGQKLVELSEYKMKQNATSRGLKLHGSFVEINDPAKMTGEQIAEDVMNPHLRINFWEKVGYRACFKDYVQLLKYDNETPVEKQIVATYCTLFVKPACSEWASSLPQQDLREIIFALATISNMWPIEKVEGFSHYKNMLAAIRASEQHELYAQNQEDLRSQVEPHRQKDYASTGSSSTVGN